MTSLDDYEEALTRLEITLEILEDKIKNIGNDCIDKDSVLYSEMKEKLDSHKKGFNNYTRIISRIALGNEK